MVKRTGVCDNWETMSMCRVMSNPELLEKMSDVAIAKLATVGVGILTLVKKHRYNGVMKMLFTVSRATHTIALGIINQLALTLSYKNNDGRCGCECKKDD